MLFNSIKEINRLISKGMSNIYLKVTIKKKRCFQNFHFLSMHISLNFKTSYCNLKVSDLGGDKSLAFLLF